MSHSPSLADEPFTAPQAEQLLFYRQPEILTPERHGGLRLFSVTDFSFSKAANTVAVTISEWASAMASYPIVFAAKQPLALAVLGLETANLFVGEDGVWRAGHYVPAYIRRYPFVFITHPDGKQLILGIDRASPALREEGGGAALFEGGVPSKTTEQALAFCGAYQQDYAASLAFIAALEAENLLIDHQAQITLPAGRLINLTGFRVVDRAKLAGLADAVIADWHKKGWLALVYYHLASLERFAVLIGLANNRAA